MTVLAEATGGWSFDLVGWPIWLVLPLGALAFWGIRRLASLEVSQLPERTRRGLMALRGATALLVVIFLVEPTCTRRKTDVDLPKVTVLLDTSGSMATRDTGASARLKLDEATALGLVAPELRDTTMMSAEKSVEALLADVPAIANALSDLGRTATDESLKERREQAVESASAQGKTLRKMEPAVVGLGEMSRKVGEVALVMEQAAERLRRGAGGPVSGVDPLPPAASLERFLKSLQQERHDIIRRFREAQEAADAALVAGAEDGSDLAKGLAELDGMTRFERARRLVTGKMAEVFEGKAKLEYLALGNDLAPVDVSKPDDALPMGPTDFEDPLTELARDTADDYLGGVLIVSDGRQTAGSDPVPAVRALRARGAGVAAVMVGSPEEPRDAVVGEIIGSSEVFCGETVRLDVRFRITGFPDSRWNLILSREGKEIERRTTEGTGQWQQERFEFPAETPGLMQVQARLERSDEEPPSASEGETRSGEVGTGGILREYWNGIGGITIADLVGNRRFRKKPNGTEVLGRFESPVDWAEDYGSRLRGWVVPPQTGSYTFWLSSDDCGQLWLGTDESQANKTLIASVDSWAGPGEWSKFPTQKSKPVSLRGGRAYYVEVLHKEGSGGDHVAVGWQMPDSSIERPIPGARLIPWQASVARKLAEGRGAVAAAGRDSEASLDNNQSQIVVSVNEDPLKVILVDNHPRWESRYLMTLFERDRRIELVRRFRAIRLPRGEREVLPPTQEKLDRYDLVVLGDIRADELSPEDQERVVSFVAKRGGFLVVLAGPRGLPGDYSLGGIADVLPVKNAPKALASGGNGTDAPVARRTALALARAGRESPITAVLEDPKLNLKLWPALPPVHWIARGVGAKVGAQVLLESADDRRTPVVAAARFGAGRVLYVGTDETWRWRDRLGDRVHQTFWLQALRWGLGARLRGKDARLQVSLDRTLMTPEDAAELRGRGRLASGEPVAEPLTLRIERLNDEGDPVAETARVLEMALVADIAEIWRQAIQGLDEGRWRLTVTSSHADLAGLEEVRELTVRKDQGLEGVDLAADLAALGRLAEAGGHRAAGFLEAEDVARGLARELEPRRRPAMVTRSLWDNYLALAAVLGLLLAEWFWRKRHGLP
ncbi:MAG: PA14 domain-containing protein [Planctomycetota bacterium]|jgi:hypothetical protein